MRIPQSPWARAALVIPALIVAYVGYVAITGSASILAIGTAQERQGGEQSQEVSYSQMAETLRARAQLLDERESELDRREQELAVLERDLLRMRRQISDEREELERDQEAFQQLQEQMQSERVQHLAQTLQNTKATVAAAQLQALYNQNRSTALLVLTQLDARSAGKIFSKMANAELAASIMEDLREWRAQSSQ